ncbi:MAG: Crp/Fnr family transcriptional regulator [Spirochaetes bacterium]|nr:Crp/Fnr family transcriptional regulator [Spirochaetota bacterium]
MSQNENARELVKAGQLLFIQGHVPEYMYYVHGGAIEILSASSEFDGLDPAIITSKSKRIGIIKGDTFISGLSIGFNDPSTKTVRIISDSHVSKYPVNNTGISEIIRGNVSQGIIILTHMFKRLELAISDDTKYTNFYNTLCKINDNFSLIYKSLSASGLSDKLNSKSESLYNLFKANSGTLDDVFEAKFLISDNSKFLRKKYAFPGLPIQSLIEPRQCTLVKKFLKLDKAVFGKVIKEDITILQNMIEMISDNLLKVLDRIYAIHNEIDSELETLFGSSGWSSYLTDAGGFDAWQASGKLAPEFVNNFLSLIKKLHSYYLDISGNKLIDKFPGPKKIHGYYVSGKSGGAAVADENVTDMPGTSLSRAVSADLGPLKNSLQQIFEFALIDKEFQRNFSKLLNDFKNISNPFSTEQDGRKIRRAITKGYWDLFKQVFIRKQKESVTPVPVNLMMKFGYLDESMLEDDQIKELNSIVSLNDETGNIPVLYEEEFLSRIYKGKENPSITEMGLSYEMHKREEEKRKGRRKANEAGEASSAEIDMTMYEIDHRLAQTVAVCSGSTSTAFPILTSMVMKSLPSKIFMSKKKVESTVRELMEIDYSVFYRETTLKLDNARELIQEEVIPVFIIIPGFGTKTMLWQELDGKNRRTRGRIVIPAFCLGDLTKSLAHTFACFRWELNRTIKGGLWADPVEGGVTGAYFDYINFYKKNSKLSAETKEKITERFKSLRTNRDRFADDYTMWLMFEKDGVMRLNSVVREMFYRSIPFKKEIREKLEGMPAFSETATRYKNIQAKSIEGYERRFKKYMNNDGSYPEKIQEFMAFLNS